jgi:asparagine synthetase B (glutamine-hydrolysing)
MCGILFYRREGADPRDAAVARAMTHIQSRGPDGQGTYAGKDFVLGHTRLAIIDPTETAAQPFTDASGRFVISYNGEIYNYAELRRGARACEPIQTQKFLLNCWYATAGTKSTSGCAACLHLYSLINFQVRH